MADGLRHHFALHNYPDKLPVSIRPPVSVPVLSLLKDYRGHTRARNKARLSSLKIYCCNSASVERCPAVPGGGSVSLCFPRWPGFDAFCKARVVVLHVRDSVNPIDPKIAGDLRNNFDPVRPLMTKCTCIYKVVRCIRVVLYRVKVFQGQRQDLHSHVNLDRQPCCNSRRIERCTIRPRLGMECGYDPCGGHRVISGIAYNNGKLPGVFLTFKHVVAHG
jgi:hypothetical protein